MSENSLSLVANKLSQLEEYLSLVERGAVGPSLGHGAIWNRQKTFIASIGLDVQSNSFSFCQAGRQGQSPRREEGCGRPQSFLEKVSGGLGGSSSGRKSGQSPAVRKAPSKDSAKKKPLLILLENAQWMDATSFNKVKHWWRRKVAGKDGNLIVYSRRALGQDSWSPSLGFKVKRAVCLQLEFDQFRSRS